jgi:polar amino acid transport system permease protein
MTSTFDILLVLLRGAGVTVQVTVLAAGVGCLLSLAAAFGTLSRFLSVRALAGAYVELFRGTSLLVQLFFMYYVLPLIGLELPKTAVAMLGLGLNMGAYGSEVVRTAILAVPKGQREAAVALNLSPLQSMRRVVLPQAVPMMLPPFGNLLIELLKGTALVSMITLSDATLQAMQLRTSMPSREPEIFALLLVIYFALACPLMIAVRWLERRYAVGRR